ncbi:DUF6538 domain-containing protein [Povalibacter sp.]|uniref:DUF6538 domain-containing protein n=1 Tax=Povalibacter sp. TaxID=1962978 RepID=UPI0039C8DA0D
MSQHLSRRPSGIYAFRLVIPAHLSHLSPKGEIHISLGTTSRPLAVALAARVWTRWVEATKHPSVMGGASLEDYLRCDMSAIELPKVTLFPLMEAVGSVSGDAIRASLSFFAAYNIPVHIHQRWSRFLIQPAK